MDMDDRMLDSNKIDEIMLPGFRFHPTDEELVAFYLKRKIQQQPLAIELIKQLDIYKHDPWDLPKLAATGEKEWYFYCPRDRKYRNSARPNRVTGAGFWKATGTDRPIYSSEGTKCIGLKKSLVFYKGKAAKGIKTDWMMHEFRLPSLVDNVHPKRFIDKAIPANDAWAICRIFKKTNTTAQRAVSHSWISSPSPDNSCLMMLPKTGCLSSQLSSNPTSNFPIYSYNNISHQHQPRTTAPNFSSPDHLNSCYKSICMTTCQQHTLQTNDTDINSILSSSNMLFPHDDHNSGISSSTTGEGLLQALFNGTNQHHLPEVLKHENETYAANLDESTWSLLHSGYGFSINNNNPLLTDAWKSDLVWDSSPCLSEMSTSYKCATLDP